MIERDINNIEDLSHTYFTIENINYNQKENSVLFKEKCKQDLSKLEGFYPLIPKKNYHHRMKTYYKIKMLKKILSNG